MCTGCIIHNFFLFVVSLVFFTKAVCVGLFRPTTTWHRRARQIQTADTDKYTDTDTDTDAKIDTNTEPKDI